MPASGPVTVDTPLGSDVLSFMEMRGREALGEPFEYTVDFVSADTTIDMNSLLGEVVAIHFELTEGQQRHFHGHVTSVEFVDNRQPGGGYRLVLRPWLWLLTNTADSRIFQNKSVPDIVKQIFRDRNFTDFEDALSGDYPELEYVAQYREDDFNFVSRLLESVGIYYFFRHSDSAHTLVLADSYSAHEPVPQYETLPYRPPDANRDALIEYVDRWVAMKRVTSGAVTLRDFDFERPNANLTAAVSAPKSHTAADGEVYDYPGDYKVRGDGETLARVQLERRQEPFEEALGHTDARGFTTGALVSLTEYPRDDQNRKYLVVWTTLRVSGHGLFTGATPGGPTFSCDFQVIPSTVPYRPALKARKPVVEGPQTATVVGQSGEEIWTDKYGRVKLQFHWDRVGERNEKSSCWVRVSQAWAGSNWGAIHIPRIGQEVIVDFLEGDPDRPIVTGRVYNANNMPPYGLPANQTQSGIKSRSTKGGGQSNANEIRFEDRKGSEEFHVQAEKDMNTLVKNNESRNVGASRTTSIGADETLTVGNNRTAHVKANEKINVDGDETMTVVGDESRTIGGDETVEIDGDHSVTIGGDQTWMVAGDDTTTVAGDQALTVAGSRNQQVAGSETVLIATSQTITTPMQTLNAGARTKNVAAVESATIGGSKTENIGGSLSLSIGGSRSETVGSDESVSISGGQSISVGKDGAIKISQALVIDAGDEITIKAGDASITLKKNGDITIKGNNLTSDASGKVSVKASSDLVLKGSKISAN
ncbi:MAG TPA: type VI secretion system tip protein TssI/VgrG [Polyangiaceae bacterium]|nr:type VI secretion system tip protein TssI/VgrG [Polyangiaceae bacterium]